uniref:Glutathione S-transferase 1 n=1 Tax=Elaeophora elaphi TaxID=1147741 RepID=A0A0R3RR90_9BILA
MPSYKLYYFDMMGRAEIIRLIFAQAGVPYEDVRIQQEDWPTKYKSKMPFETVPVLEEDGKMLSQSTAIAMYLAKKFDLVGENEWELAQVEELFGVATDLIIYVLPWFRCKDAAKKKELMADFETQHLIPTFRRLEGILAKNETGYFVGKKLTAADLNMLCMVGFFGSLFPNSVAKLTHLNHFKERMMELPKIKKWVETRPKTDF